MPSSWEWWVGNHFALDDGEYDLGCVKTREDAIAVGLRETAPGELFYIIEARSSTARKHEGADFVPFTATRNATVLCHGIDGVAKVMP